MNQSAGMAMLGLVDDTYEMNGSEILTTVLFSKKYS